MPIQNFSRRFLLFGSLRPLFPLLLFAVFVGFAYGNRRIAFFYDSLQFTFHAVYADFILTSPFPNINAVKSGIRYMLLILKFCTIAFKLLNFDVLNFLKIIPHPSSGWKRCPRMIIFSPESLNSVHKILVFFFNYLVFINTGFGIRIHQIQMITVDSFLIMRNRHGYSSQPYAVLIENSKFKIVRIFEDLRL